MNMVDNMTAICEAVRYVRKQRKMTMRQAAANMHLSDYKYQQIENGTGCAKVCDLIKVCNYFGLQLVVK